MYYCNISKYRISIENIHKINDVNNEHNLGFIGIFLRPRDITFLKIIHLGPNSNLTCIFSLLSQISIENVHVWHRKLAETVMVLSVGIFASPRDITLPKIVEAFRGMHVSPAKHSSGKCDRKVWQTDGQTDRHATKLSLCVAMLRKRHKNYSTGTKFELTSIFLRHIYIPNFQLKMSIWWLRMSSYQQY